MMLHFLCAFVALCESIPVTIANMPEGKAKPSPYSLIIGDLDKQWDPDDKYSPCEPDEELCMDTFLETRLKNVEVIAGKRLGSTYSARHRGHVPYRKNHRARLAMIVGPMIYGDNYAIMIGEPDKGKICVHPSWFDREKQGMILPKRHSVDERGAICFRV